MKILKRGIKWVNISQLKKSGFVLPFAKIIALVSMFRTISNLCFQDEDYMTRVCFN
jgi:hypothetical protein